MTWVAEFKMYLRQCTDQQVRGAPERPRAAGPRNEIGLARAELARRGLEE